MHNTPPTLALPTMKNTQHKRKQSTAKDQMRQRLRGSQHNVDSWRIMMTDWGCLLCFPKEALFPCYSLTDDPQGWKIRPDTTETHLENSYHAKCNYGPIILVLLSYFWEKGLCSGLVKFLYGKRHLKELICPGEANPNYVKEKVLFTIPTSQLMQRLKDWCI